MFNNNDNVLYNVNKSQGKKKIIYEGNQGEVNFNNDCLSNIVIKQWNI